MKGTAALARSLSGERASLADAIVNRLASRGLAPISGVMVRSLVSALGQSIQSADPEAVLAWTRLAKAAHSFSAIRDAVATACDLAAERGEQSDIDFSALLVFLEIVKTNVAEACPLAQRSAQDEASRVTNGVIEGVLVMLKAHDEATCAHSHATGAWCRRLAEAMNLGAAQTDFIVKAGILHDIGKIGTPDEILFKPSALTNEEWTIMQRHAEFGAQILAELPALAPYAAIVRAHHERWDGKGYPNNLKGEEIPFEARVVAVADAFHAMISNRPYRPALAQRDAMAILREGRGTQWDANVIDAMLKMLEAPRVSGTRQAAQG